jgi:hypothetical protein
MGEAGAPDRSETRGVDPTLEYTPRFGPGGPVTVRGVRLLVALTLVNTTLLGMSVLGPQLFPFLRQTYQQWKDRRAQEQARQAALALQQQCLDHVAPPGQVVYDEDPAEGAKRLNDPGGGWKSAVEGRLRGSPPGWVPPVKLPAPAYFPQYTDEVFGTRVSGVNEPLLYLGGRTTPGGERHVVTVQLATRHSFGRNPRVRGVEFMQTKQRMLTAHAYPAGPEGPAGARHKPRPSFDVQLALPDASQRNVAAAEEEVRLDQSLEIDYGNVLRFFAGQGDPADPSHFTIPYDLDGRPGVIDGWLRDDGLKLRPREGEWAFTSEGASWKLPAGPAASGPAAAPTSTKVP